MEIDVHEKEEHGPSVGYENIQIWEKDKRERRARTLRAIWKYPNMGERETRKKSTNLPCDMKISEYGRKRNEKEEHEPSVRYENIRVWVKEKRERRARALRAIWKYLSMG
jgi:hypothetical protein